MLKIRRRCGGTDVVRDSLCSLHARTACRLRSARRARAVLGLLVVAGLAACAGDETLSLPVPPKPDVPKVEHDTYPTLGATPSSSRPTLSDKEKARLQGDLERLARDREAKVRASIEAGN